MQMQHPEYLKLKYNKLENNKKIEIRKTLIRHILFNNKNNFKKIYNFDYKTILSKINEDIVELSKYFILCTNELKKIDNNDIRLLIWLFQDLNCIEDIYYKYKNTNSLFYKRQLSNLINPYIEEMKLLIDYSKGIFKESEGDDEFIF